MDADVLDMVGEAPSHPKENVYVMMMRQVMLPVSGQASVKSQAREVLKT
jgi:hypothetical protein